MVENKLINVSVVYGESSYYVKLESLELNTRYEYCLKGYIKHKNNDKDFTFCSLIDEKLSIILISLSILPIFGNSLYVIKNNDTLLYCKR